MWVDSMGRKQAVLKAYSMVFRKVCQKVVKKVGHWVVVSVWRQVARMAGKMDNVKVG